MPGGPAPGGGTSPGGGMPGGLWPICGGAMKGGIPGGILPGANGGIPGGRTKAQIEASGSQISDGSLIAFCRRTTFAEYLPHPQHTGKLWP